MMRPHNDHDEEMAKIDPLALPNSSPNECELNNAAD